MVVPTTLGRSRASTSRSGWPNCTVFDDVRATAYREVVRFKDRGASPDQWHQRCVDLASGANREFHRPLSHAEIRAISKSIARWTWRHFSPEKFSELQSRRGSRPRKCTRERMAIVEALRHAGP